MGRVNFSLLIAAIAFGGLSLSAKAEDQPDIPPMVTLADGSKTQKGAKDEDGKWVLPDGWHDCLSREERRRPRLVHLFGF